MARIISRGIIKGFIEYDPTTLNSLKICSLNENKLSLDEIEHCINKLTEAIDTFVHKVTIIPIDKKALWFNSIKNFYTRLQNCFKDIEQTNDKRSLSLIQRLQNIGCTISNFEEIYMKSNSQVL